jgi:hypothetical protein
MQICFRVKILELFSLLAQHPYVCPPGKKKFLGNMLEDINNQHHKKLTQV